MSEEELLIVIEHPCEAQNDEMISFTNKCPFCGLATPKPKGGKSDG